MRETRTSGSTRGEPAASLMSLVLLLYWSMRLSSLLRISLPASLASALFSVFISFEFQIKGLLYSRFVEKGEQRPGDGVGCGSPPGRAYSCLSATIGSTRVARRAGT